LLLREHVGLPIAVAVVDQRPATGRRRDLRREVAPLPDRAEPFVQEDEHRLPFAYPFISDRMARGFCKRHAMNLARDNPRLYAFHYLGRPRCHAAALVGELDRGTRSPRGDLARRSDRRPARAGARHPAALRVAWPCAEASSAQKAGLD